MKNYDTEIFYENYWTTIFEVYTVTIAQYTSILKPFQVKISVMQKYYHINFKINLVVTFKTCFENI